MNLDQIYAFLNENSAAMVATSEDNVPHLRTIWTVKTDKNGVLFHTGKMKEFFQQLIENPRVEMCFTNSDKSIQIRVSGVVRQIEDPALKLELLEKRPFLKDIEQKTGSIDFLSVFLLEKCLASVWTFATNIAPKEYIKLN
jgi:uncharacterized pyridoxamine 5'-phosphate oxidase family protein